MKKMYFTVLLAVLAVFNVNAQDHKHGSPHGGTVKSAGDFHIEVSVKEGMVMAYLLDGNEKAMANNGVTGTALLQTADGKTSTITFKKKIYVCKCNTDIYYICHQ